MEAMHAPQSKLSSEPQARLNLRYAHILRCIGQSLESVELKAIELKIHGDLYLVQGWSKGAPNSKEIDRQYTQNDLRKLESEWTSRRKDFPESPNLLSLAQVLRLAGSYVDRMRGRLIRVSWQDQSDRIQSITIQYEPFPAERSDQGESQIVTIEELSLHVYKQRKKIVSTSDKSAQRPLVSVSASN